MSADLPSPVSAPTMWTRFLAWSCLGAIVVAAASAPRRAAADGVLDWNATLRAAAQHDGTNIVNVANPGWFTRSAAMMNGAIYDAFQAVQRTHQPLLVNTTATGVDLDAAVHEAAYRVLKSAFAGEAAILDADYATRMALVPDSGAKTNGVALGAFIAQQYIAARANDHAGNSIPYTPGMLPGQWRPDPFHPGQQAWGPGWGEVTTFAIGDTAPYVNQLPGPPDLASQQYVDAFEQVKSYGAVDSVVRTAEQEEIAMFWAYDRATMGPPPVLYNRNLTEIATQAGNTAADNARLFAMGSVAMADAAIAAWDAKFTYSFWRPVTAIHEAGGDGNPATAGDLDWRPLGAPGSDPQGIADDFTPPFPAWVSGHATMGSALFKTLELFYETNDFDAIDGVMGNNPTYHLTSQEFDPDGISGMVRQYHSFTQTGSFGLGLENSPEGENGASRVYMGIHWIFDQTDGMALGSQIATFVAGNRFQSVPEPASGWMALTAIVAGAMRLRRNG